MTVGGPRQTVSPAFSVQAPSQVDSGAASWRAEAENFFISLIGLPTCSNGASPISPTTIIIVNQGTTRATSTPAASLSAGIANATGLARDRSYDISVDSFGISQPVKIGVAVAVPVYVVALVTLGLFLLRRYRNNRRPPENHLELDGEKKQYSNPYVLGLPEDWLHPKIDGLPRSEMEEQRRHELPDKVHAQELES